MNKVTIIKTNSHRMPPAHVWSVKSMGEGWTQVRPFLPMNFTELCFTEKELITADPVGGENKKLIMVDEDDQ